MVRTNSYKTWQICLKIFRFRVDKSLEIKKQADGLAIFFARVDEAGNAQTHTHTDTHTAKPWGRWSAVSTPHQKNDAIAVAMPWFRQHHDETSQRESKRRTVARKKGHLYARQRFQLDAVWSKGGGGGFKKQCEQCVAMLPKEG